jgi:hypothetical protein
MGTWVASERDPPARKWLLYAWVLLGVVSVAIWAASSWQAKKAGAPSLGVADASSVRYEDAAPSAPVVPGAYFSPPAVDHYPLYQGRYRTDVRFGKSDGPWEAQESRFELWFDGDVEPEFQSRGFEDPVNFEVKVPEPGHVAIHVTTPPWSQAAYISFEFKSVRPVSLVRVDVSPAREGPPRIDR